MKKQNFILMLLLAIIGFVPLASCSSDDGGDSSNDKDKVAKMLIGTWRSSENAEVLCFRKDGTGVFYDDDVTLNCNKDNFKYTFSIDDSRLTIDYGDDDKDTFIGVVVDEDHLYYYDEDEGKRFTLNRVYEPLVALYLSPDNGDLGFGDARNYLQVGAEGADMTLSLCAEYIWHESYSSPLTLNIKPIDGDGILKNFHADASNGKAKIRFSMDENKNYGVRKAKVEITPIAANGNMERTKTLEICQLGMGNSMEVSTPGDVSYLGGNVFFYVYSKDKNNISVRHDSDVSVKWTILNTSKYPGGNDYMLTATIPFSYATRKLSYTFTFEKSDGSVITRTLNQEANSGGSTGGGTGDDGSVQTGKVKATAKVIGPGLDYSIDAQFYDGKTCTIDYTYNPSTGKYYIYGGPFDSHPESNDGKGLRYDAKKGYNSICVNRGAYFDYSYGIVPIKYNWELYLRFTLP